MEMKDLFIDVGARDEAEAASWGVRPGCPIAPYSPFVPLKNERLFSAKAFDNRIGVALGIETLRNLGETPGTVIGAGCVQEEVGLRGARTIAASARPDVALVLEAPPADDVPGFKPSDAQGRLGGGVQIRLFDPTMIANPRLADLAARTAKENGIPHQVAVRSSGGTNAGEIHKSGFGGPTIVLGVPTRYIHSHVSVMNIDDYRAAADLIARLIERLDRETVGGLV